MRKLIVFEGPDNVGKTTLIAEVSTMLRDSGLNVLLLREPGGSAHGEAIRELLLQGKPPVSMLAACALLAANSVENSKIASNYDGVVLLDRWAPLTSRVFQTSLARDALEHQQILAFWDHFVHNFVPQPQFGQLRRPDQVIYVFASEAQTQERRAAKRGGADDNFDKGDLEMARRRYAEYQKLSVSTTYGIPCATLYNVDLTQTASSAHSVILSTFTDSELAESGVRHVIL